MLQQGLPAGIECDCWCCSKALDTDEALRAFLTGGVHQRPGGRADEAGPSAADLRELRSLSLSFSLVGPPIGVSLPDSDLHDLRCFLQGKSIPSLRVPPAYSVCAIVQVMELLSQGMPLLRSGPCRQLVLPLLCSAWH